MTAQQSLGVLRAYAFVVRHDAKKVHMAGSVASNFVEALTNISLRHNYLSGEMEFFNHAFAPMEPAHIIRWDGKEVMGTGSFSFLEGMFFGEYEGARVIVSCAKVKLRNSLLATVYGGEYEVRPL